MKGTFYPYLKLFEAFIRDSKNGTRRLKNGNRIRKSSIANYTVTLKKIAAFEQNHGKVLTVRHIPSLGRREQRKEMRYWEKFGQDFGAFLHAQGLLDNYVCFHKRQLKTDGGHLLMNDGSTIPVSTRRRAEVVKMLEEL